MDQRKSLPVPTNKFFVELCCLVSKDAGNHLYPRVSKTFESLTRNQRVRIFNRTNDTRYSCFDQCFRTRSRLSLMIVRLKRNVRSSPLSIFPGPFESDHLGVLNTFVNVCSLSNCAPIRRHYDASNKRIWADQSYSERSQTKGRITRDVVATIHIN